MKVLRRPWDGSSMLFKDWSWGLGQHDALLAPIIEHINRVLVDQMKDDLGVCLMFNDYGDPDTETPYLYFELWSGDDPLYCRIPLTSIDTTEIVTTDYTAGSLRHIDMTKAQIAAGLASIENGIAWAEQLLDRMKADRILLTSATPSDAEKRAYQPKQEKQPMSPHDLDEEQTALVKQYAGNVDGLIDIARDDASPLHNLFDWNGNDPTSVEARRQAAEALISNATAPAEGTAEGSGTAEGEAGSTTKPAPTEGA